MIWNSLITIENYNEFEIGEHFENKLQSLNNNLNPLKKILLK